MRSISIANSCLSAYVQLHFFPFQSTSAARRSDITMEIEPRTYEISMHQSTSPSPSASGENDGSSFAVIANTSAQQNGQRKDNSRFLLNIGTIGRNCGFKININPNNL